MCSALTEPAGTVTVSQPTARALAQRRVIASAGLFSAIRWFIMPSIWSGIFIAGWPAVFTTMPWIPDASTPNPGTSTCMTPSPRVPVPLPLISNQ